MHLAFYLLQDKKAATQYNTYSTASIISSLRMSRKVWILSLLVFNFTGNFPVVSDQYENGKSRVNLDSDSSLKEVRWTMGPGIPDIEYGKSSQANKIPLDLSLLASDRRPIAHCITVCSRHMTS